MAEINTGLYYLYSGCSRRGIVNKIVLITTKNKLYETKHGQH
jgi:hypothetical protein